MSGPSGSPLAPVPIDVAVRHQDRSLHIERQIRHLELELQALLDAQSEGLAAGLRPDDDATTSTSSRTPTPSLAPTRLKSVVPVRQPTEKKIGLRGARQGILRSMDRLITVKDEEHRHLVEELGGRENALNEVSLFIRKRHGLETMISKIEGDEENLRLGKLKSEAGTLEKEIQELEWKLYERKSRQRQIVAEISQFTNTVDAQLASYKSSLSMLESSAKKFLAHPPLSPLRSPSPQRSSFYALKQNRRTLELAQEHWKEEQAELRRRIDGVVAEKMALKQGGLVWHQVMTMVSEFEKRLRHEMRESAELGAKPDEQTTQHILKEMDSIIKRLEAKLRVAERKDWNLLVCSIGAELEAFKEAKEELLRAFEIPHGPKESAPPEIKLDENRVEKEDQDCGSELETPSRPPSDLLKDIEPPPHPEATARSDDEEDEPDPSWLLSHT